MTTSFASENAIATLTINNPPVNALGHDVRVAIIDAVRQAEADPQIKAMVIACEGTTFCAGADVREFGQPSRAPLLPEVVDAIMASSKPVVAALFGTVLGGGLKIAMASHGRVAAPGTRLGLPEVKLGLIPGARGTQLLPRLVGVDKALAMICSGEPIGAQEAADIGLIDGIADGDLLSAARALAQALAQSPATPTSARPVPPADPAVIDSFLAANARKFRGLAAQPAAASAIRAAIELPYAEACQRERELFVELREGPQSRALRHVFQAERAAAKLPELDGVQPRPVESVGVIGAGTMGSGIAINFLLAGIPVTIVEQTPEALDRGVAVIARNIDGNVASGRTSPEAGERAKSLLTPTLDYAALGGADLIIEAAFEDIEIKKSIFERLGTLAKPGAILASNTSYLDIDAMADASGRPADVLGMHFFSPANIMKLLEIVRGTATAPDVLATALAIARIIRKVPVVSGNAYGFIGNRMLAVRRKECDAMILEGASPYTVDRVLEGFGLPMGPFRMADLAGLDIGWNAQTSKGETVRARLCEAGRRGQKTGAGFYDYDENRKPVPAPLVEEVIARFASDHGVTQRAFSDDEILARLIWPMVNEGAQLLVEGIARSTGDIDVVWLNGYGWPVWTGGPMQYARETGYAKVADELRKLGYEPSATLLELAN